MANEDTISETPVEFTATADDGSDPSLAEQIVDALFDDTADTDDDATEINAEFSDSDGDGNIDIGTADTDGDGQIDIVVADTDGDGTFDTGAADVDGDGQIDLVSVDTDGDGVLDTAYADADGDGEFETVLTDADGDGEFETVETVEASDDVEDDYMLEADSGLPTEAEISTNSVEFNIGDEMFQGTEGVIAEPYAETPIDGGLGATDVSDMGSPDLSATEDAIAGQQAQEHSDAAVEAQAAADGFVEGGDYAAAAEAREVAENESYEAGDDSMLGASDSSDLENAAYKQEVAEDYQTQQADHIAEGDYESAKEDAQNAAYATGDADYKAGGSDHTGQSDNDEYNLDWAAYQSDNADQAASDADYYAAQGDFDKAEVYADRADDYNESAVDFADQGDPTSINNDFDPSAVVETGGSYDAGFDASAGVDTGFDSGADMSTPDYDSPMDDNM